MVASPSVRKITRGTRWDERCLGEDGGFRSWAADSRAALMLVPDGEETQDESQEYDKSAFCPRIPRNKEDHVRLTSLCYDPLHKLLGVSYVLSCCSHRSSSPPRVHPV